MSQSEHTGLHWTKSSMSVGLNACVEFARAGETIMVRDSKNPGVMLSFSKLEIEAMLYGAQRHEFDHLIH